MRVCGLEVMPCSLVNYLINFQKVEVKQYRIRTWTSIPGVVFEPTIPVFDQTKTVHTFDGAAAVTGGLSCPCA
jgi:hypothetical protein